MAKTILITGATGMFGREMIPVFLDDTDAELILLMHRRGVGKNSGTELERFFSADRRSLQERVRTVAGDVTQPHCGLSDRDYDHVCRTVTHILHSAAVTRFDQPLESIRKVNLGGTRNTAALAAECKRLQAFGYVSTAYVAGRRTGVVLEHELEHDAGFVNTYERSKYETECFLRPVATRLPVVVYRLSTVLGNSRTGAVWNFTAPHHAMRMMHLGLASMVPGTPGYLVDMIPGDVAARAVVELFVRRFCAGDVFHVTAGPDKSFTLEQLIDEIYRTFGELDTEWRQRNYPKPVLAPVAAFDLFLESVEQAKNPFLLGILRAVRHFADQLTYPKTFDRRTLLQRFPEYEVQLPDIGSYYSKVVRYCLQTDWGKNAA